MNKYIELFSFNVPLYSICVYGGIVVINIIAIWFLQKNKLNKEMFLSMEIIGGIGALIGSKLLVNVENYIYVIFQSYNFTSNEKNGYAYFGGLFAFYLIVFLFDKYSQFNFKIHAQKTVFLLPLLHVFWKVGCFCAGCCEGIPYTGKFSVIYPFGVNALSGVESFPVQILEALIAIVISLILYLGRDKLKTVPLYLILYGSTRFLVEFLRYHPTTITLVYSLTVSVVCVIIGVLIYKECFRKDVK